MITLLRIAKITAIFCFLVTFAGSDSVFAGSVRTTSTAAVRPAAKKIRNEFDRVIRSAEKRGVSIGFKLVDVERGGSLYSYRCEVLLIPASTTKLVTSAMALRYLGPDFRFSTKFFSATDVDDDGTVKSDLYIVGEGDPLIREGELREIVASLSAIGVRRIYGNIIVDDSFFEGGSGVAGWERKKEHGCYEPFIGATSFNFNSLHLKVIPPFNVGQPPDARTFPCEACYQLNNNLTVATTGRPDINVGLADGAILVSGTVGCDENDPLEWCVSVPDAARFMGLAFAEYAKRAGILIGGNVSTGKLPEKHRVLLFNWKGKPLREIIKPMNKHSNNFMAEQIFRATGAKISGQRATWSASQATAVKFLSTELKRRKGYKIVNGSGLSRSNRLSAGLLTDLLCYVWKNSTYAEPFLESLPVMGVDGTLRHRNRDNGLKNSVLAKTGSLSNVDSLAGYLFTDEGKVLAFAILMNVRTKRPVDTKSIENKLLLAAKTTGGKIAGKGGR